jgi:hypothetical protein
MLIWGFFIWLRMLAPQVEESIFCTPFILQALDPA